jgi:hypothetical protein
MHSSASNIVVARTKFREGLVKRRREPVAVRRFLSLATLAPVPKAVLC